MIIVELVFGIYCVFIRRYGGYLGLRDEFGFKLVIVRLY